VKLSGRTCARGGDDRAGCLMLKDRVWAIRSRIGRLYALLRAPRHGVCAEIGVWQGGFSARIVQLRNPRELHLIDPWQFDPRLPDRMYGGSVAKNQADMDAIMAAVVRRFADVPAVKVHRHKSLDAAKLFPDGYFDWVYIDGDHSYEAVLADLEAWLPKVKPGGAMALDDYIWRDETGSASVKAAADSFLARHPGHRTRLVQGQFVIRKATGG